MEHFSFWGSLKKALSTDYFNFSGCATRKEFWCFQLTLLLIQLAYSLIGYFTLDNLPFSSSADIQSQSGIFRLFFAITVLWQLYCTIPMISIAIRRLHDRAWSGWWQLLCLIPLLGYLFLLIIYCLPSKLDNNPYRKTDINSQDHLEPSHFSFFGNIKKVLTKDYFNFKGYTTRKEFWSFQFSYYFIISTLATLGTYFQEKTSISAILMIFVVYCIIPQISITVRRLHDIAWKGWWVCLNIISFFGISSTLTGIISSVLSKQDTWWAFLIAFLVFLILRLFLLILLCSPSKLDNNPYRV